MRRLQELGVGTRLILGFSVMIVLMGIIGLTGFHSVRRIEAQLGEISNVRLPSTDLLLETDRDLHQLLVAERSMIFANTSSDAFRGLVKEYESNLSQSADRWQKYTALPLTPAEREIIPAYEQARTEWEAVSREVVEGREADTMDGRRKALDLTLGPAKEKFEAMRNHIDRLTAINLQAAADGERAAAALYRRTIVTLFAVIGVGILSGILLAWSIGRGVTRPLKAVIEGLTDGSELVSSASSQVSSASKQLAEGASEQAASLEETSSSLEEIASMTKQNAEHSAQADRLMKEANGTVKEANDSMADLTSSMEAISSASEETSKIIKTIDEIAFQTNLLALNAAVEAARAGEAGAGFAVVADEVRNLAMQAAGASKTTATLIEGTVKKIKDGSGLVARTNDAFSRAIQSSNRVGELIGEIAAASHEQAQGIDQITKAVHMMDKVVQQNAASAEEAASAAEEMNTQAGQMTVYVNDLGSLMGARDQRAAGPVRPGLPEQARRTTGLLHPEPGNA